MKYEEKKTANYAGKKDNTLLYGTILLLAVGFFILIGLVFVFAGSGSFGMGKCIGIVEISDEITTASIPPSLFTEGTPGSEDIANAISSINKRDDIASVVFVINSPGGSVVGSREIYDSIKEVKQPKVAYFREVAASGGYYVSAATDYIISDPNALTGSIGVVTTTSDMSAMLEKIGINITNIATGKHKDIGAFNRPMDNEEYAIIQGLLNETFQEFVGVVLEGRKGKLNLEKFEQILDGRVLTGRQAKEIGLVDALGTKKDAIEKAAALGGLTNDESKICMIKAVPQGSDGSALGLESFINKLIANSNKKKIGLNFE